jgi:hypothetical protein
MEHSLPRPEAPVWRTATLVAAGVAAVEFALLLALGVPMLARFVSHHVERAAEARVFAPAPKPAAKKRPVRSAPALPRRKTPVVVLNGNGRTGAASAAGRRVHRLGYPVRGVGNAPRSDYARTIVVYRPGRRAEADRLARDVGAKVVGPLDGLRPRDLRGAQVALILGAR